MAGGSAAARRAYLDHASSSPLRPASLEAMRPWLAHPGDPGRVHSEGRAARVALEEAREQVAAFFGARPREVIFTSGGTESINAAIFGAAARSAEDVRQRDMSREGVDSGTGARHVAVGDTVHIVTTA
ncbi:MAG TPA: aminotransferase class V-fold PLP-dependent enzyme, partial [Acidimicrobiia bacterium]|nr:aminotransferase class V-fold PLP-dependent enzyme [Acidimicrobiia bacterium]